MLWTQRLIDYLFIWWKTVKATFDKAKAGLVTGAAVDKLLPKTARQATTSATSFIFQFWSQYEADLMLFFP